MAEGSAGYQDGSTTLGEFWWKRPKGEIHEALQGIMKHFENNQGYRRQMDLQNLRLYGGLDMAGLASHNYAASTGATRGDRLTYNIVQSIIDTKTNKIAKNKPKPMFLTEKGNAKMRKKAQMLNKFIEGIFYQIGIYEIGPEVFNDAEVGGTGFGHLYRVGKKICMERAPWFEIECDDAEAFYGKPRNLFRKKTMTREVLIHLFPKFKDKILTARRADTGMMVSQNLANQIEVTEAWHLRSGEDAKDGRHVIAISNADLLDEKYERDYFPFPMIRSQKRKAGYYGQGAAERLTPIQYNLNKCLQTVQRSLDLCGVPFWLVENNSKALSAHFTNEIGRVATYTGTPPTLQTPNPVPEQLFRHLYWLIEKGHEQEGVSQLSAQSQKPAGLNSGKALREYNDIESERFNLQGQGYENWYLECAAQAIDLAKEIYEELGEYDVVAHGRKGTETISWSDISLEADEYVMKQFPISAFPDTPTAKMQSIQEYVQAGFFTREQGMMLMDFPDLEGVTSLITAAIEDILDVIGKMVDDGEYQTPEPYQNFDIGIPMVQSAYLKAKNDHVPEENLELLRQWMTQAKAIQDAKNPPQQAPGTPPPGAGGGGPGLSANNPPQAAPQPTPTSELIPNTPGAA